MPAPDWQILIARTMTGEVVDALDGPVWAMRDALAWAGDRSLTATLPLPGRDRGGQIVRASLRSLATARSSLSLVLARDRAALFAGPVTSLRWTAEGVETTAAGLPWVFERRMVCQPAALDRPAEPAADVALTLPPGDRAVALLTLATTGVRRGLPLTLPAPSGAQGDPVTYAGSALRTTHEAIKDIVEADGGPDIVIAPVLSADLGTLSWVATLGAPHVGGANPDAVWDFPLVVVAGDIDDSETVDRAYVQGASTGSDAAQTVRIGTWAATDARPDAVALERTDRTSTSETNPRQLDALARSWGEHYGHGVEELTVATPTDVGPQYRTQYQLGDDARFAISAHPWLDDIDITARVVALSLTPETCDLTVVGGRGTGSGP